MALRIDGSGFDYLSRSTVINHNAAYSWLFWIRPASDLNQYTHFVHAGGGMSYDGNTDSLGTDNDGTALRIGCAGGASNSFDTTGDALTTGQAYWLAVVRESATVLKVYIDGVLTHTLTNDVSGRSAASGMFIGEYNFLPLDGRTWGHQIYTRALSAAEVAAQMAQHVPLDATSLWSWLPMVDDTVAECALDYSGNGRDWTVNGTLAVEAEATPPWVSAQVLRAGPARLITHAGAVLAA